MELTTSLTSPDRTSDTGGHAAPGPARDPTPSTRIERMPIEVGVLLLASGMIAGMLPPPPGPFDLSLMLAGGVALWPCGLRAPEGWTQRSFPQAHRASMSFLDRFLDDLEHRYPGSTV